MIGLDTVLIDMRSPLFPADTACKRYCVLIKSYEFVRQDEMNVKGVRGITMADCKNRVDK